MSTMHDMSLYNSTLWLVQATGAEVLNALQGQRQQILNSKAKLGETDQNLKTSQKILKNMSSWLPWWGKMYRMLREAQIGSK